jgi:phospholipase/carboxylesterase
LQDRQDEQGIGRTAQAIDALIADQMTKGIAPERMVLAGFSQGCAVALHVGLRQSNKLAGIMALSGYLPLAESVATQRSAANQSTPIYMAHGTQDTVVLPAWGQQSRDLLQTLGYAVQWHSYPMAHSVHPQGVVDMSSFLRSVLR